MKKTSQKYDVNSPEERLKRLIASRPKMMATREELKRRGYTKKDVWIIKFLQHPTILKAIKLNCFECQGYSFGEAKKCTNNSCPLWIFRQKSPDKAVKSALDAYRKHMIDVGELNPKVDVNINFKDILGDDSESDDEDDFIEDEQENTEE